MLSLLPSSEVCICYMQAIADTPSFIFLWVGDGVGLEQGRQCLKKVSRGCACALFSCFIREGGFNFVLVEVCKIFDSRCCILSSLFSYSYTNLTMSSFLSHSILSVGI